MPGYPISSTNFRRFWLGQGLSSFGRSVGIFALPVIAVTSLHASSGEVGLLESFTTVSSLLIGLPAGVWVDHMLKRTTMMVAAAVRCLVVAVVPVFWYLGMLQIWMLYLVAFVTGVAIVFFDIAYESYIPSLVPDADIGPANTRLEGTSQISATAAPAIAGALMRVVSSAVVLIIDASSYLVCFVALALTHDAERCGTQEGALRPRRSLLAEVAEGLRYVRGEPVIRRLAVSIGISNFFATILATLFPILVLRVLGLNPFMLGVTMAVAAVGGLVGATLVPVSHRHFSKGSVMAGGLLTAGLFTLGCPVAALVRPHSLTTAVVILLVGQFGVTVGALPFYITQMSVRQTICPKSLLGRMNASMRFIIWGAMPLAALVAGGLGDVFGVVPAMWAGAIGAIASVLPILGISRLVRESGARDAIPTLVAASDAE